jgi:hypothetical protein
MTKQGIEPRIIPEKKAPESDATTEEWDKKSKNKEATNTPVEQAKLSAKDLADQILAEETRTATIGEKLAAAMKEAEGPDVTKDTLTQDVAEFEGKRIVQVQRTDAGVEGGTPEHQTTILQGDDLEKARQQAQEDLRSGEDRRSGETTRRNFETRSTVADANELVSTTEREARMSRTPDKVGAKKGSQREKKKGGDRRQKGSTWKPVNVADEAAALTANKRPGGKPDRRRRSLLDLDVGELKDSAARGDPIAVETLEQYRREVEGRNKMRRAPEVAAQTAAKLGVDIERAERGTPESTSVWDEKAQHRVPAQQMDVNADLMPEAKVYSGDPIKQQSLEQMDKSIENLRKRINAPGAPVLHKGEETLAKLIRRRNGLATEIETAKTRQFPTIGDYEAEGNKAPGEKVIPRTERRKHVRGPEGRRNEQMNESRRTTGAERRGLEGEFAVETPVERRVADTEVSAGDQRKAPAQARRPAGQEQRRSQRRGEGRQRGPHTGPERGSVTRPAPDLTIKTPVGVPKPVTPPLTSPSIGANLWETVKRGVVKGFKPKNIVKGGAGFAAVTAMFAAPKVAEAYVDASGDQRARIKAAGGESLEEGIAVGVGMGLFSGGLHLAQKAVPGALAKAGVGLAGAATGSAAIGWAAGTAAGNVYSRVRRVSEKNKRDAEFAQAKYGTPELARRTRLGLDPKTGKPPTLDDAEEIMKRWEREEKKLNKRRGAKE